MQLRRSHYLSGSFATSCALLASICLFGRSQAQSDPDESLKLETKIHLLISFAKHSDWGGVPFPAENSPIVIGILGNNPFPRTHIQLLEKARVSTHPLRVRICKGIDDLQDCHMLFIPSPERTTLAAALKRIENQRVLTISDAPGFTQAGGIASIPSVKKIKNGFWPKIELKEGATELEGVIQVGLWKFKPDMIKMIAVCNKNHG